MLALSDRGPANCDKNTVKRGDLHTKHIGASIDKNRQIGDLQHNQKQRAWSQKNPTL